MTYANVASTLALVLAISGVAYAAAIAPNSVGTRHLKSGAVTTAKLDGGAVTSAKVQDRSLRLRDLGGRFNDETRTLDTPLNVPSGGCVAKRLDLSNPTPKRFVGSLVVGYLTDADGDAVFNNNGVIAPTVVGETSQGGALIHLVLCDEGGGQSVPAGSVFHYRVIGP